MVSDSARAALRIRGCLGTRGQVVPGGIVLWTEEGAGEWKASAGELSEDLMLLGVPHYVTYTSRVQPPWRGATTKLPPCRWEKIWIIGADFGHLVEAVPSFGRLDVPPAQPPENVRIVRRKDTGRVCLAIGNEELVRTVGAPHLGDLPHGDSQRLR